MENSFTNNNSKAVYDSFSGIDLTRKLYKIKSIPDKKNNEIKYSLNAVLELTANDGKLGLCGIVVDIEVKEKVGISIISIDSPSLSINVNRGYKMLPSYGRYLDPDCDIEKEINEALEKEISNLVQILAEVFYIKQLRVPNKLI